MDRLRDHVVRSSIMFKRTDRQRSLFESGYSVSESASSRLRVTWADGFQAKVLPILLNSESDFAELYADANGRPNWSVARMLGICVLQEMLNLHDQEALDSLAFDVRWQHALGMKPADAYLSRRSLVDFRSRLVAEDRDATALRRIFERIGESAIRDLKISTSEQRIDSTNITSNILSRGRVDLFRKTLLLFLRWVSRESPEQLDKLSTGTRKWFAEIEEQGWFGLGLSKEKAREILQVFAQRLHEIKVTFLDDELIRDSEEYALVIRVLDEHCHVVQINAPSTEVSSHGPVEIELRKHLEKPSTTLQSPFDPDAGYGYKGSGYTVQVAETCRNEHAEIITDFEVVPSGKPDFGQEAAVIDRLQACGVQPKILYADGGYPTGEGILDAKSKGVELFAPVTGASLPEGAIGRDQFTFDEATGDCTRCPAGHAPHRHADRSTSGERPSRHAYFDGAICRACPLLSHCIVRHPNNGRTGSYHLDIGANLIARDRALVAQRTLSWRQKYKIRSGVEATMSELKRGHGMGRLRVRRLKRVRAAVALKIIGCNVKRWLRACANCIEQPVPVLAAA